jgi:hypothetical protein
VTVAIADTTGATLPSAKTEIHKTKIATQTTIVAVLMVAAEGPGCLIPNVPCTTGLLFVFFRFCSKIENAEI